MIAERVLAPLPEGLDQVLLRSYENGDLKAPCSWSLRPPV